MQGRKTLNLALLLIVVVSLCLMAFDFYVIHHGDIAAVLSSKIIPVRLKLAAAAILFLLGLAFLLRALVLFLGDKAGFRIRTIAGAALIGLAAVTAVEAGTTGSPRPWWLLFWELFFVGCLATIIIVVLLRGQGKQRGQFWRSLMLRRRPLLLVVVAAVIASIFSYCLWRRIRFNQLTASLLSSAERDASSSMDYDKARTWLSEHGFVVMRIGDNRTSGELIRTSRDGRSSRYNLIYGWRYIDEGGILPRTGRWIEMMYLFDANNSYKGLELDRDSRGPPQWFTDGNPSYEIATAALDRNSHPASRAVTMSRSDFDDFLGPEDDDQSSQTVVAAPPAGLATTRPAVGLYDDQALSKSVFHQASQPTKQSGAR